MTETAGQKNRPHLSPKRLGSDIQYPFLSMSCPWSHIFEPSVPFSSSICVTALLAC